MHLHLSISLFFYLLLELLLPELLPELRLLLPLLRDEPELLDAFETPLLLPDDRLLTLEPDDDPLLDFLLE